MKRTPIKRGTKPLKRGTLTRSTKRLKARKVPKGFRHRRDYEYQKWVRAQRFCLLNSPRCNDYHAVDVAHLKTRATGGDDHANIVPLCRWHHEMQHRLGIPAFERLLGVNLKAEAAKLWIRYQEETGR